MKNRFCYLLLVFAGILFAQCDDNAEVGKTYEGYFMNVFDINKSYAVTVFPDTSYFVNNINSGDGRTALNSGDRAYMTMKYYYDPYSMIEPEFTIVDVHSKVKLSDMSAKGSFDGNLYNSAFATVEPFLNFQYVGNDFTTRQVSRTNATFLWADKNTQNIAVAYDNGKYSAGEYKMTLDSLRGSVLYFRLYANLRGDWVDNDTYSYEASPQYSCKILSYNMDWDFIYNELTDSEKAEIVALDSLTSNISLVVKENSPKDANGIYIPKNFFTNDKFANPLYNRK